MGKAKIIKRYRNRKLYDTEASCYVTLDDVAEMVQRDEEMTVIDSQSQKDITSNTLMQIIFEKQRRSDDRIPVSTLRYFIQQGKGDFSSFLKMSERENLNEVIRSLEEQIGEMSIIIQNLERNMPSVLVGASVVRLDA